MSITSLGSEGMASSTETSDSVPSDEFLIIDERYDSGSSSQESAELLVVKDQDGNPSEPEVEEDCGSLFVNSSIESEGILSSFQKDGCMSTPSSTGERPSAEHEGKRIDPLTIKASTRSKLGVEQEDSSEEIFEDSEDDVGKIRIRNIVEIGSNIRVYTPVKPVKEMLMKSVNEKQAEAVEEQETEPKSASQKVEDQKLSKKGKNSDSAAKGLNQLVSIAKQVKQVEAVNKIATESAAIHHVDALDATTKEAPTKPVVSVAKKSCSGRQKRKYLSESDDPVPPSPVNGTKTKVKKHKSSAVQSSSESADENDPSTKSKNDSSGKIRRVGHSETISKGRGSKVKSPVKKHKKSKESEVLVTQFSEFSASSNEEDDEPLILRIKREDDERGITKEMPKPPLIIKKKKHLVDAKPELPRNSRKKGRAGSDFDPGKKRKIRPTESNPHLSTELREVVETMIVESKKTSPDFDKLQKGMDFSWNYRKYEYEKGSDIPKTLEAFPALSDYRILKQDFEKYRDADLQILEQKLDDPLQFEYHKHFRNSYTSPNPVIASAKEQFKKDSDNSKLLRDIQMLCLGDTKSKGKLNGVLYQQRCKGQAPFKGTTPTIDIRNTLGSETCKITVYCEGAKFTQVPNFCEAILCVYSIYWIFNICYEKKAKPFFEFFDSLIGV